MQKVGLILGSFILSRSCSRKQFSLDAILGGASLLSLSLTPVMVDDYLNE